MVVAIAHSPQSERHLVSGDSTLEQLRQTLSRTPSKGTTTFQVFTSKTSSPAQSPRSSHAQALSDVPLTLFPISAKKKRPILRHMSPMRFTRGSLGGQRAKRILQESTDNGNSSLQSFATIRAVSPNEMQISTEDENNMLGPHHALGRKEKSVYFDIVKSSPLKRSESNFDSAQAASPSAKRRSVHGSSFAPEFNLPERETLFEGNDEIPTPTAQYSPTFRGKNALRSASLATRFDTVPAIKSRPTVGNIWDIQAAKARNRLSLDFPMPDDNDDSPFALDVSTQSSKEVPSLGKLTLPPRHPLSRTMTQSSSNSDIAEDSPTHGPIRKHLGDFRRPFPEFTRSLPIGGTRPRNVSQDSDESGYATPSNYRLAKPHPAAFMSTGLISKRNRNLTTEQLDMTTNVSDMPDTPCKRPISVIALMPMPTPSVNPTKARSNRQTSHSFGTPSTPFNPQKSIKHTGFGPAIFGSDFNQGSSRRGSFADKVEDVPKSPVKSYYNRNVALFDISSTPTKQASANNPQIFMDENVTIMDSKSIMVPKIKVARVRELDDNCLSSPSPKLRFKDLDSIPFFSKRSARGRMQCPSPLSKFSVLLSSKDTKLSSTASPIVDLPKSLNPVVPPDPSSLSISGHSEKNSFVRRTSFNGSLSMNLPATPTAARDSMRKFSSHAISVTPSNNNSAPFNVDPSITSRFDKVEPLSTGEFSQVFRVFAFAKRVPLREIVSTTSKGNARANSVWVVKKSKNAYIGPRDRIRKLQEVETLKALGQADHTIRYFDHWEHHDHLYIQTEYCEEGTLHGFLMHAGQSARLDDFRIWKIMLEMSKGLKHIHDSGFIHLDIKPANVLVSFEGVLKIGDFGMSSTWPAPPNIEGEGDREYIGPEILKGQFDKPADVFAFGLMMLEIAGNVMLPDNGTAWQRLRSGDMSDVPSLTSSSDVTNISRDVSGHPVTSPVRTLEIGRAMVPRYASFDFGFESKSPSPDSKGHRLGELRTAPEFMTNAKNTSALDKIVRWMISPEPRHRPNVNDLLATEGVRWVALRRRAGATIYEGNFGPADEVLNHDAEMIDV